MKQKMTRKTQAHPERRAPNLTGIPAQMKAELERRSGQSLDDVRVHYNSGEPAGLGALAFTRGTQVHIGPGQERHLRHELGHVIQQKRNTIRPTAWINGQPVNDSPEWERSADTVWRTAANENAAPRTGGGRVIQPMLNPPDPVPPGHAGAEGRNSARTDPAPQASYRYMERMRKNFSGISLGIERELLGFSLIRLPGPDPTIGTVKVCPAGGDEAVVLWITTDMLTVKPGGKIQRILSDGTIVLKKGIRLPKELKGAYSSAVEAVPEYTIELIYNPISFLQESTMKPLETVSKSMEYMEKATDFVLKGLQRAARENGKNAQHSLKDMTMSVKTRTAAGKTEEDIYTLQVRNPTHLVTQIVNFNCFADQATVGLTRESIVRGTTLEFLESAPWYTGDKPRGSKKRTSQRSTKDQASGDQVFANTVGQIAEEDREPARRVYDLILGFLRRMYDVVGDRIWINWEKNQQVSSLSKKNVEKLLPPNTFNNADIKNKFGVLPRSSIMELLDELSEETRKRVRQAIYLDFLSGLPDKRKWIGNVCFQYLEMPEYSTNGHPSIRDARIGDKPEMLFEYRNRKYMPPMISSAIPEK